MSGSDRIGHMRYIRPVWVLTWTKRDGSKGKHVDCCRRYLERIAHEYGLTINWVTEVDNDNRTQAESVGDKVAGG